MIALPVEMCDDDPFKFATAPSCVANQNNDGLQEPLLGFCSLQ
jgi:hypothetical protein